MSSTRDRHNAKLMKILFYETPQRFGTDRTHIFELLNNLSRLGHSIVWANGEGYLSTEEPNNVNFNMEQRQSLWERVKRFVMALPLRGEAMFFWNFLKEISLLFLSFMTALRCHPDIIYRRHTLFGSQYFLGNLLRIPSVKEVNGIIADEAKITKKADKLSLRLIDLGERFNMPKADKIIVVTSKLKEVLHNDYRIPEDKIVVIENGANLNLFKPMDIIQARKELNLSLSANYICFVGNLIQWQGVEYLIQSALLVLCEIPETKFLIVGDGQMKKELVELARQIGISDKVIFTGMVPYERVPLYINASDVCVAPFVKARNERGGVSPLKMCEYLACEKPSVASKLGGLQYLEQHAAGILVEPENPEALAGAIIKLLQNPQLRKQMGENGRKYAVENRSWESVAKKVAEVCAQAIKERA